MTFYDVSRSHSTLVKLTETSDRSLFARLLKETEIEGESDEEEYADSLEMAENPFTQAYHIGRSLSDPLKNTEKNINGVFGDIESIKNFSLVNLLFCIDDKLFTMIVMLT